MPDPGVGNYMTFGLPTQSWAMPSQMMASPGFYMAPQPAMGGMPLDMFTSSASMGPFDNGAPAQIQNWGDVMNLFGQVATIFSGPNLFDVQANININPGLNPGTPIVNQPPGITPSTVIPGGNPPKANLPSSPRPAEPPRGLDTLPKNPDGVPIRIIEVGTDGKADQHSNQVAEIFSHTLGNDGANAKVTILGHSKKLPPGGVPLPKEYKTQKDLDQYIDFKGTYILSQMAKEISKTKSGVINVSAAWTRMATYIDVISLLKENPRLAKYVGLSKEDLKSIKLTKPKNKGGESELDLDTVSSKVKAKVVKYVDSRFTQGSKYMKAFELYQKAAHEAVTKRHVNIVVAAANYGEYRKAFPTARNGADTNFLALSQDVIVVAAADTHGTADLSDDTIAPFSSWGVGRYTPTVAAIGVNLPTSYGEVSGTSFASPYVAAVVTRMLQENPDLKPSEIKKKLRESCVKNNNTSPATAGAGMLDAQKALESATE
jgi:hypothetical protein